MTLRVVFMGTPEFAVPAFREIVRLGQIVPAVYSRAPRPAGRGMAVRKSPVHEAAEKFGILVRTPTSLRPAEEVSALSALAADVVVVVAYGLILPPQILAIPRLGAWNLHGSLLPRWRGAAPIERAIMAGDNESGVMVMRMEEGLDTGPVALTKSVRIETTTTSGDLTAILAKIGAELMGGALARLESGGLATIAQASEGVTYADKIDKTETRVDWSAPAATLRCRINGLSPFPGAWCEMPISGRIERVKVLRAGPGEGRGIPGTVLDEQLSVATGSGAVRLLELQRPGGKPLDAQTFLRGSPISAGTVLGPPS